MAVDVDEDFGMQTEEAVKVFQRRIWLTTGAGTGVVDASSWSALVNGQPVTRSRAALRRALTSPLQPQTESNIGDLGQKRQPSIENLKSFEQQYKELENQLQQLTEEGESQQNEIKPPLPRQATNSAIVRLVSLRKADAAEVANTLQKLLDGEEVNTLRIATHQSNNSIILRGNPKCVEMLEAILTRLDEEAAQTEGTKEAKLR
jgi:type II secretory pathway component GspD/PulD (secretin)